MSLSRSLVWVSLAFLAGIVIAGNVSLPVSIWLFLAGIALALGLLWRFLTHSIDLDTLSQDITSATSLVIFLLFGAARYQSAIAVFDAFDLGWYNDRPYETLVTDPDRILPRLADFLGVPESIDAMRSCIDPALYRERRP